MVNNSTVPVGVHGFAPKMNLPTRCAHPGSTIKTPQFRTPHGIASNPPVTGARAKQTDLGASKARQNS